MHARLLACFLAVYESHGISAAAERLRITQPAVSKAIQKLEGDLGVALFERRPGGVVPTRYADILARRVRLMDIQYRHALAEIAAARGGSEGLIRIGAGPVWYSCFLPPILDRFASLHPHVRFSLRAGVIDTLIPGLIGGEIDIVCASLDFPNRAEIAREPIIDLRHVVVAADSHPLAGRDDVAPEELARFPWVTLGGDHVGTGRIWSYFAAHGCPPPRIAVESSSQSAILELVAGGRFLAHMPEVMARQAARHGVRPLVTPGVFWETPAGIAYRQSEHQLPMLRRFIEAVRAIGRRG